MHYAKIASQAPQTAGECGPSEKKSKIGYKASQAFWNKAGTTRAYKFHFFSKQQLNIDGATVWQLAGLQNNMSFQQASTPRLAQNGTKLGKSSSGTPPKSYVHLLWSGRHISCSQ